MKTALITGITGQDGAYLAELLLNKGYNVHGLKRRSSLINTDRIDHLIYDKTYSDRFHFHHGDLTDASSLLRIIQQTQPDEIYNLAAQSHVRVSFDIPEYTADITGVGAARILEAIVESGIGKKVRFYQASSSEMFGKVQEVPQKETTAFWPRSPYACAKAFAHWLTVNYREAYGLFACSGILFNHESPRRGENFVTRKITLAAANIKAGRQASLCLGNIDAKRDWGYAKEYVEGMWLMLQQEMPGDYVLATNRTHTIGEFLTVAFGRLNLDWHDYVKFDERLLRPAEVDLLIGDYSKAKMQLGWEPKTQMKELAELMVDADVANLEL